MANPGLIDSPIHAYVFVVGLGFFIIDVLYVFLCVLLNRSYEKCLSISDLEKKHKKGLPKILLVLIRFTISFLFIGVLVFIFIKFVVYDVNIKVLPVCFIFSYISWVFCMYFKNNK